MSPDVSIQKIVKQMLKYISYSIGFEGQDLIGLKAYYAVEDKLNKYEALGRNKEAKLSLVSYLFK